MNELDKPGPDEILEALETGLPGLQGLNTEDLNERDVLSESVSAGATGIEGEKRRYVRHALLISLGSEISDAVDDQTEVHWNGEIGTWRVYDWLESSVGEVSYGVTAATTQKPIADFEGIIGQGEYFQHSTPLVLTEEDMTYEVRNRQVPEELISDYKEARRENMILNNEYADSEER